MVRHCEGGTTEAISNTVKSKYRDCRVLLRRPRKDEQLE